MSRDPSSPVRDMEPCNRGGWSRRSPRVSPDMASARSSDVSPGCRAERMWRVSIAWNHKRNTSAFMLARGAISSSVPASCHLSR